jgi:RNA polymerase sigma factor for flagellar operon FliA
VTAEPRDAFDLTHDGAVEVALWHDLRANPESSAREALFDLYVGLARQIARRHHRNIQHGGFELADLHQLAVAGLLEAIDLFDPRRGSAFKHYAQRRIGGSILDGIAESSEIRRQISFRNRAEYERTRSLTPGPGAPLSAGQAMRLLAELATSLALGFMLEGSRLYVQPNEPEPGPNAYDTLLWRDTVLKVRDAVSTLPAREGRLVRLHYLEGVSFDAIAALFQLSKGRVSQVHKRAIGLLRERLAAIGGGFDATEDKS